MHLLQIPPAATNKIYKCVVNKKNYRIERGGVLTLLLGKKILFVGWGVLTLLLEIVVCCRLGCVNIVITSRCLSEGSQLVTGVN